MSWHRATMMGWFPDAAPSLVRDAWRTPDGAVKFAQLVSRAIAQKSGVQDLGEIGSTTEMVEALEACLNSSDESCTVEEAALQFAERVVARTKLGIRLRNGCQPQGRALVGSSTRTGDSALRFDPYCCDGNAGYSRFRAEQTRWR